MIGDVIINTHVARSKTPSGRRHLKKYEERHSNPQILPYGSICRR